ncbi:hypothetical protein H2199_001445 [Coniosporium tulheliwenetii]|uniref:Uncharacterized protein n=1 Tax=Coniosporium tulheliwenetii TaxID=3383036 RepID=A0ACC2ZLX6_9PEZI|nr:hypothetical protein H2199_001445 [Cladosporium sp. JES 115]
MAAPETASLKDLNGKWVMNKTLSDETDSVLALQGVGWLTRKAIALATITLHTKEYVDDASVTHIDIDQTATGGIKGTSEQRVLDNQFREHTDHIFGELKGRSRWFKLSALDESDYDEKYLKEGWEKAIVDGEAIESFVENGKAGWTARQIWGFMEVKGDRRYVRNVVVVKGDQVKRRRLVYDWAGKE